MAEREEKRERVKEKGAAEVMEREGGGGRGWLACTSTLLPRDVVKYVAIYTGDWRHWRLGSE